MSLIVRVRQDDDLANLNFYAPPGPAPGAGAGNAADYRASWWDKKMPWRWASTRAAAKAYKNVLEQTNISWSKVTHLRKSGMDKAGTKGLPEESVSSMSKHSTAKIKRYVPQLNVEVMKVMAGFNPNEEYYVPRALILPPWTQEQMTEACFPRIHEWRAQAASPHGDHTGTAANFLHETLPFLALCAFQDGIFWTSDFPNNSASIILRNTFPNYEAWALSARNEVFTRQNDLEESKIRNLDIAVQASYNVLGRQMVEMQASLREQMRTIFNEAFNETLGASARARAESLLGFAVPPPPVLVPASRGPFVVQNALTNLRTSPIVPVIPEGLPKSMFDLYIQHHEGKWDAFENRPKTHWPQKSRLSYSKRQYLYKQIQIRVRNIRRTDLSLDGRMRLAAQSMDQERGDRTVNRFMEELKSVDPAVKKRKRKVNDVHDIS